MTVELSTLKLFKGLRLLSQNICSLLPIIHLCEPLINASDVCIFTESWLSPMTNDTLVTMKDYTIIRQDGKPTINKRGGGIVCYVKSKYQTLLLKDYCLSDKFEILMFKLLIDYTKPIILIGNIDRDFVPWLI